MNRRLAAICAIVALAAVITGCGGGSGGGPVTLSVYVSAPLHGQRAAAGTAIENGARLALADAGGRVGKLRVRAVYLDDTSAGRWSMARTAANARRAAEDITTIGYVGELDSGATRVSLPITNQAEIAQISPGSTAVDLTRLPPVGHADPSSYRPSGERTFVRVVADDDVQSRAAAIWARRLGARSFTVSGGRSAFARITQDAFGSQARSLGLRPLTRKQPAKQLGHPPRSKVPSPDAIYYGLSSPPQPRLLGRLFTRPSSLIFAPETILDPTFLHRAAPFESRLHVISPFLAPGDLSAIASRFLRAYRDRFGAVDPAAAYGYESMALLLDAIRRAGGSGDKRGAVIDALLATSDRKSILGTYSIDGNGDTTLDTVSGYRVSDSLPVFPVKLRAPR